MSVTRRSYVVRLIQRIAVLFFCVYLYIAHPKSFDVLDGMNFFTRLSPLHVLWGVWVFDMLLQILPFRNKFIALGSQKLFAHRYTPVAREHDKNELKKHIKKSTLVAYVIFAVWWAMIAVFGVLYFTEVLSRRMLFMVTPLFYVFDLVCVLIVCPFRFVLKNRCCTSCRIFNWDHMMMFSPIIFLGGFYSISLVALSFITFFMWELNVYLYPERFWTGSNASLKCANCTEKLCSHRCNKKINKLF